MLDRLRKYEEELLRTVPTGFYRYLYDTLKTHDRLIGLVGTSGMGKTTLLLQRTQALREEHGSDKVLYITLDYPFLANMDLVTFAEELHAKGVRYLLIDELHRHPRFRQTLKTIYDKVMGMQIIFAGSAGMDTSGLGARLTLHRLQGLSFREVMSIGREDPLPHFTLSEILSDHTLIAKELSEHFDIAKGIRGYLRRGYYPAHADPRRTFTQSILQSLNTTLDTDLVTTGRIEQKYTYKMRRVLEVLSLADPGRINLSRIADEAEISRVKLYDYLTYMQEAGLLRLIPKSDKNARQKAKPARIYIDNTNLRIFYNPTPDIRYVRETFFVNQVGATEKITANPEGIFFVNNKWRFQVSKPAEGKEDYFEERPGAYRVVDTLISDHPYRIPLWLFGFLY